MVKLSEQWDGEEFKGYRKFINGRMFTLGKNEEIARLKAAQLEATGARLKAAGKPWSDPEIDKAMAYAFGQPDLIKPAKIEMIMTGPAAPKGPTVHDALDRFSKHLEKARQAGEFGQDQLNVLNAGLEAIRALFPTPTSKPFYLEQPPLQNMTIAEVSEDDLEALKAFLLTRPTSLRSSRKISAQYVSNLLKLAGRFFKFAKKAKLWPAFEDWKETFQFRRNQKRNMLTAAEKSKVARKDHMTLDDLAYYWNHSDEYQRMIQGLAFFCAWTQKEVATFRTCEFYRDADGEAYIDKQRSKTGEVGKWWLPMPIAKLVEKYIAMTPENPDGLALLTPKGKPLVHHGRNSRQAKSDYIGKVVWKPIQVASQKERDRSHSFKWFRKSLSNQIGQHTNNKFIAKAALSQHVSDVADVHYLNPLIDASIKASKELWDNGLNKIYVVKD